MRVIDDIKKKKELSGVSDGIVKSKLEEALRQNPKLNEFLERERSEGYKKIIKLVRAKLHSAYGVFQDDKSKVPELIDELKRTEDEHESYSIHRMLLSSVLSTKERLPFYEELYARIFEKTGWPKSIIDLGCGLNPMSFPFMRLEEVEYKAYDLDEGDIAMLNRYFEVMGDDLDGKASLIDLENMDYGRLPEADVGFAFKVLDLIDKKGHKKSEELIKSLKCKSIVVSFSTKTVSGRPMEHPYRGWLDQMLKRLGYEFSILKFENEIFYVIKKA